MAQLTSLSTLLCVEYSSGWESLLSRMWRDQGRSQSSGSECCSMARGAGLSKSGSQASQQLKAESLSTDLLDYKQKTNERETVSTFNAFALCGQFVSALRSLRNAV